jgi:hypothetical protein
MASGRTTVLNIGQRRAPLSVARPRQQASAQVASTRGAVYGSDAPGIAISSPEALGDEQEWDYSTKRRGNGGMA